MNEPPPQGYAYSFDPYGVAVLTAGGGNEANQNPFLFKGGIQDRATGWVLYGNRWYNPTIGRWTQQDTLDAPLDPNNAYAGCDPINNTDPVGRITCQGPINRSIASTVLVGVSFVGLIAIGAAASPLVAGAIASTVFAYGVARTTYYIGDAVNRC